MLEPRVGAHLSVGSHPRLSLGDAATHGVQCMQMFVSSPGAWKAPVSQELRAAELLAARTDYDIDPLFIHSIYLINLASADANLVRRSKNSLVAALHAGVELGAAGVVTHIGSHTGRGFGEVAGEVAAAIRDILADSPASVDLLLENSAGAGALIGSSLDELAELLARAGDHARLKVALDTAHLCGAGWDFTDNTAAGKLVGVIDRSFGLERLALVHANDSRVPPGSHRDRHANIGEGYIGEEGFQSLLAQPALTSIPWLVETPDLDTRLEEAKRYGSVAALQRLKLEKGAEMIPAAG